MVAVSDKDDSNLDDDNVNEVQNKSKKYIKIRTNEDNY